MGIVKAVFIELDTDLWKEVGKKALDMGITKKELTALALEAALSMTSEELKGEAK